MKHLFTILVLGALASCNAFQLGGRVVTVPVGTCAVTHLEPFVRVLDGSDFRGSGTGRAQELRGRLLNPTLFELNAIQVRISAFESLGEPRASELVVGDRRSRFESRDTACFARLDDLSIAPGESIPFAVRGINAGLASRFEMRFTARATNQPRSTP